MAVANPKTIQSMHEAFLHPTDRCFYCGNPLGASQWVYWNGNDEKGQQIWLHVGCALALSDNLVSDFRKAAR